MDDDLPTDPKLASLLRAVAGVVVEVTRCTGGREWIAVCCRSPADRELARRALLATGAFEQAEPDRDYLPGEGGPAEWLAYFRPVAGVAPDPRGPLPN